MPMATARRRASASRLPTRSSGAPASRQSLPTSPMTCARATQIPESPPMPTISTFYGILIQMFWRDHVPPHFHALYAEHEAQIDIRTLEVIEGDLPKRALVLVLEWASEHRSELMEDWDLCARM